MSPAKPAKEAWRISPDKTALVVIDMQKMFVETDICVGARDLVPKINELAAMCRKVKIPVIFVSARSDLSDPGLRADMDVRPPSEISARRGIDGIRFCDGLDVTPDDFIIPKKRYSALIRGSSVLEQLLRGLGKDSFIICGVLTDVCVGTTTTDGMMLGFKVFLPGDLTATASEERQKVALQVYDRFARITTFSEVMKELSALATAVV
ncbi:MAG: cysteine hydrolase [Chloroflexi bacterium]|nr:cysteine hydrolase [Chloroflexota bacterium]